MTTDELAEKIISLDAAGFQKLWQRIGVEMKVGKSDLESVWYDFGSAMERRDCSVISALHSAVISGQRSSAKRA